MLEVKIKRLSDTAIMPTYGSDKAAGMDLYADIGFDDIYTSKGAEYIPQKVDIPPHSTVKIHTGFAFQPPTGYCGKIYARSGLATKHGLRPSNCTGICDEDYTGEYIVAIHNDTDAPQNIHHGDRIAQLVFEPYEQAILTEVTDLDTTDRGSNGFGSTGK